MSDPRAAVRAAVDRARAGVRAYEDAVLAESERQDRLTGLGDRAKAERNAEYAQQFRALRDRVGAPGGGVA